MWSAGSEKRKTLLCGVFSAKPSSLGFHVNFYSRYISLCDTPHQEMMCPRKCKLCEQHSSVHPENYSFIKQFNAHIWHQKSKRKTLVPFQAIDMELRKLDVTQANLHVSYLRSFMPDNFLRRGGKDLHQSSCE